MSLSARATLFLLCLVFTAGCAQPLQITFKPRPLDEKSRIRASVTVFVEAFTDERGTATTPAKDRNVIGRVSAVVSDYAGSELKLSEGVEKVATRAFAEELKAHGYTVLNTPDESGGADFIVKGAVKKFSLDIVARDEIDVALNLKITEAETGRIIWEGDATEKNSRFAGVMGNSKASISAYITESLSKAIRGALSESTALIENTRAAYSPAAVKGEDASAPPQGTGRLAVTAGKSRAKVYINGVYYGLTPFKTDLEPGVYELIVKQKGFKESKERVSVRQGEMTEIEASLDKE